MFTYAAFTTPLNSNSLHMTGGSEVICHLLNTCFNHGKPVALWWNHTMQLQPNPIHLKGSYLLAVQNLPNMTSSINIIAPQSWKWVLTCLLAMSTCGSKVGLVKLWLNHLFLLPLAHTCKLNLSASSNYSIQISANPPPKIVTPPSSPLLVDLSV